MLIVRGVDVLVYGLLSIDRFNVYRKDVFRLQSYMRITVSLSLLITYIMAVILPPLHNRTR